uniref:Uncharacterized protein n=1 Tax=Setaria italica TaxID=4555 RepID=K3YP38_SETIT
MCCSCAVSKRADLYLLISTVSLSSRSTVFGNDIYRNTMSLHHAINFV